MMKACDVAAEIKHYPLLREPGEPCCVMRLTDDEASPHRPKHVVPR